jgi:thymidylate synthase ThyX
MLFGKDFAYYRFAISVAISRALAHRTASHRIASHRIASQANP